MIRQMTQEEREKIREASGLSEEDFAVTMNYLYGLYNAGRVAKDPHMFTVALIAIVEDYKLAGPTQFREMTLAIGEKLGEAVAKSARKAESEGLN